MLLLLQPQAQSRPRQQCESEESTERLSTTWKSGGNIRKFDESIADGRRVPQLQLVGGWSIPGVWPADLSLSGEYDGAASNTKSGSGVIIPSLRFT